MPKFFLFLAVFFSIPAIAASESYKLKVGVILALTGEASIQGVNIKNGLEFGLSDLPEDVGGKIEIIYEDDQFQPKRTVAALNKLVLQDKVDLIINSSAPTSHAIAPLSERMEVPFISLSGDPRLVADKQRTFIFWTPSERLAEKVLEKLTTSGISKIARISVDNPGRISPQNYLDQISGDSIKVLYEQTYSLNDRDFRSFITKVRTLEHVEAIFVNLFFGQAGEFTKQARQLGVKLPFFGLEVLGDKREIQASHGASAGSWYAGAYEGDKGFLDKFLTTYPESTTFASANGYDLAQIFSYLVANQAKRSSVVKVLKQAKEFKGELGTYQLMKDNRFNIPAEIRYIH